MKFAALFMLLTGWIAGLNPQSPINHSRTWAGEIDGVKSWVTVLARDRDFTEEQLTSSDWNNWGNTETDAYLFAFGRQEDVHLILAFEMDEQQGTPAARVYLNDFGRLPLVYEVRNTDLKVLTNGGFPYLTMRPKSGSWWVDGKPNYDLEILVDGMDTTSFLAEEFKTDGIIDWVIIVGSDTAGEPAWETMELINDPHPTWGYSRFGAQQQFQAEKQVFEKYSGFFKNFPYFHIAQRSQNYFTEQVFPLYFDLRTYTFQLHKFAGFQQGGTWAVNSISNPPDVDFEAPFVFYNFDSSNNYSELVIRSFYMPSESQFFNFKFSGLPSNEIRYSWKTTSSLDWQYGIHTNGLKEMPEQVSVGGIIMNSISADAFPGWVVDNEWPLIHFIEAVEGYPGSEGIYFYNGRITDVWPWISGSREQEPDYLSNPYLPIASELTYFSDESIPMGFRGEIAFGLHLKPALYISPIDNRVHLLHAKSGTWNLSENQVLRYENRSGDAYIDTWILEDVLAWSEDEYMRLPLDSSRNQALYHLNDLLVFSSTDEVVIIDHPIPNAILQINPPTDQATWEAFRSTVVPITDQALPPQDLLAWAEAFSGQRITVNGASVFEVMMDEAGSALYLEIQPGYRVSSGDNSSWSGLSPGIYQIRLRDNHWQIRPAVPASVHFVADTFLVQSSSFYVNQPVQVDAAVQNLGDVNSGPLSIELWAAVDGEPAELVSEQELTLGPAQSVPIKQVWHPQHDGQYQLELRIVGDATETQPHLLTNITILTTQDAQIARAARLSLPTQPALVLVLLFSLSLGAVLIAAVINQGSKKQ